MAASQARISNRIDVVLIGILKHALMITSFVLIMTLLIEYINVQTRGSWQLVLRRRLSESRSL